MVVGITSTMSYEEQDGRDEVRDVDEPPVWVGMTWGVVSVVVGCALMAALWSYNVQEIGWTFINDSGTVLAGCSNYLGVFGLYAAAMSYGVFGAMAWGLAVLTVWWGVYRLTHKGELEASVCYAGWALMLLGCVLMTSGQVPSEGWAQGHLLLGAGGLTGHLLAAKMLVPLLTAPVVIALAGIGYIICLVYAVGLSWMPLMRGMVRDWKAWRKARHEKKLLRRNERLAEESARVRESMENAANSRPRGAKDLRSRPSADIPSRSGVNTGADSRAPRSSRSATTGGVDAGLPRTGDDLEGLYSEVDATIMSTKSSVTGMSVTGAEGAGATGDSANKNNSEDRGDSPGPGRGGSAQGDKPAGCVKLSPAPPVNWREVAAAGTPKDHARLSGVNGRKAGAGDASGQDAANKPRVQGELDIKSEPKITVVETPEKKPASKVQPTMPQGPPPPEELKNYKLPGLDLLQYNESRPGVSEADVEEMKEVQSKIQECLNQFKIAVEPGEITRGPAITRYEFYPARAVRVNVFEQYARNIALATEAKSLNVVAPIPGKATIGYEIENRKKTPVFIRELLQDPQFWSPKKKIPVALGKNVYGDTVIGDLTKMPHLLVAGATGSGKSVCINCIIASMLLKFRPDELQLILVDPKMVEMMPYAKLPHLAMPVVTEAKKVANTLAWCVNQMERRYYCFSKVGVRNFESFNSRPPDEERLYCDEPEDTAVDDALVESIADELENPGAWPAEEDDAELDFEDEEIPLRFPYLVIIIDELADLMNSVRAEVETSISRLAAKARAAGIHLIVATQTPRKDVLSGTIKTNIPTRISCRVASGIDSRVILDQQGAEKLLGQGDLLYLPPGCSQLERAQGALITDAEVEALARHCASQAKQHFRKEVLSAVEDGPPSIEGHPLDDPEEECYAKCLEVACDRGEVSTSLLQRRLSIGYGRAARMMDLMEKRGVIGPSNGSNRPRKLLI